MLDRTLVVWMGEFGRTPKINPNAGRDHFPKVFNVALAFSGDIPPSCRQQLRNLWHLSGWSAGPSRPRG